MWPIFPSVTHLTSVNHFSKCEVPQERHIFLSVKHVSKCNTFFEMWPIFSKCDPFFQVWPIFWNVAYFSNSDPFFQVWHIFPSKNHFSKFLKLINYSCSQKPINDLYSSQVDESWYPMKHQMKHHRVLIWDETCFSSEIKHLHFNEIFIAYTTHGN